MDGIPFSRFRKRRDVPRNHMSLGIVSSGYRHESESFEPALVGVIPHGLALPETSNSTSWGSSPSLEQRLFDGY